MKYAVIDWDNTIRKGFTLFSWMDFLYSKSVLKIEVEKEIKKVQHLYATEKINHDDYAKIACEIYSRAMKGISANQRHDLVKEYMPLDIKDIFDFSKTLFDFMFLNGISPVIISGAPQYIIQEYRTEFHIFDIYAFSEAYSNDVCTGDVLYNFGMNKQQAIIKLANQYGEMPYLGFGDSFSDIPIFEMSKYAFCITNENSQPKKYGDKITYILSTITKEKMMSVLNALSPTN